MSSEASKIRLDCPTCGKLLMVPFSAQGKQVRCPSCQQSFVLEHPNNDEENETQEPEGYSTPQHSSPSNYNAGALAQLPPGGPDLPVPLPSAESGLAVGPMVIDPGEAKTERYQHGFGLEHRGWDAGMLGGLAMMAIGAIWFFGGLAFNVIFFYPPILFVIGLIGFLKGLFTGNIAGKG